MTTKENIIKIIKSRKPLLMALGVKNIGLFGSYVRNDQSKSSDIDILLDFEPEKENYDNYLAACEIVEQLFSKEKVGIVTKNGLSPYIGTQILNEVLYV